MNEWYCYGKICPRARTQDVVESSSSKFIPCDSTPDTRDYAANAPFEEAAAGLTASSSLHWQWL